MSEMELTAKQRRFVVEYPIDSNGTQAAIRAGYSQDNAGRIAVELLSKTHIQKAIEARERDIAAAAAVTCESIVRDWDLIRSADPREVIQVLARCCRHCYGTNHEYQWHPWEFRKACEAAAAHRCGKNCEDPCEKHIPPFPAGGLDYDWNRPPLASCPVCKGEGEQFTRIADMRRVSPAAARLIAGVKQTKDGVEIKMRDQGEALRNLAQWSGMLINRGEIAGPGGGPIPFAGATININELSDEQLAILATGGGTNGGIIDGSLAKPLQPLELEAGSNP